MAWKIWVVEYYENGSSVNWMLFCVLKSQIYLVYFLNHLGIENLIKKETFLIVKYPRH